MTVALQGGCSGKFSQPSTGQPQTVLPHHQHWTPQGPPRMSAALRHPGMAAASPPLSPPSPLSQPRVRLPSATSGVCGTAASWGQDRTAYRGDRTGGVAMGAEPLQCRCVSDAQKARASPRPADCAGVAQGPRASVRFAPGERRAVGFSPASRDGSSLMRGGVGEGRGLGMGLQRAAVTGGAGTWRRRDCRQQPQCSVVGPSAPSASLLAMASSMFTMATAMVVPFYTVMLVAPQWKWTKRLMNSAIPYIILGAMYLYLLGLSWTPHHLHLMFSSQYWLPELPGITRMFSSSLTVASAWIHLLAVDMFAGRHVYLDSLRHKLPFRHSLLLCLMFGPIGIFSHLLTKTLVLFWRRTTESTSEEAVGEALPSAAEPFPQ